MNGIPNSEIIWETYVTSKNRYIITSKPDRSWYMVYKIKNGKADKLGRAKTPTELEEKFCK